MIVERFFHYPKPGHLDDLVELTKGAVQRWPGPHASYIYLRDAGSSSPVSHEIKFSNYQERKEYWDDCKATPAAAEFWEKYWELVDRHWTNEV